MIETKPTPASWRFAAALRGTLCSGRAATALAVILALSGVAAVFALGKSFLEWLKAPVDSSALIALGIILASVASFCWFVLLAGRSIVWPKLCPRELPFDR